jgi:hypothetical protein
LTTKLTRHTAVRSCQLSAFSSQLVCAIPICTLDHNVTLWISSIHPITLPSRA